MDETRFYRRSWVIISIWTLISGIVYFWLGDGLAFIRDNLYAFFGHILIFQFGLLVWLAFFAQFVLPVRTFRDRQKIFDRLLAHMSKRHGPAVFIENGCPRERLGEQAKKGPGVLWLDSASAAVTRTATQFKDTIGPGVHFTEKDEYLYSTVDLHAQVQSLGPREKHADYIFASPPKEDADELKVKIFEESQNHRQEVSAWTRDGIEVVPNVNVLFEIDAKAAKGEEVGSRFGYEDEVVCKAITGEGVNPDQASDDKRHRVAWNRLPMLLAVDLWREYLAKFTLQELFEATQSPPSEPSKPAGPAPAETQALFQPASLAGGGFLANMLHELNARLARWADRCEFGKKEAVRVKPETPRPEAEPPKVRGAEKVTALQVINDMIKARLTRAEVPVLDDSGRPGFGTLPSSEYQLLQEHGLKVKAASVGGLRFAPAVDEQLIRQWSANWLDNARAERERIERRRSFIELNAGVEAFGAYAESLSRNLLKVNPRKDPKDTLKTLLLRTRDELLKNDRLHRRTDLERETLEEIIQWLEENEL
jgi:hypothetical protein